MKRIILILIALATTTVNHAQRSDSLSCGYDHTFHVPHAIAPAFLITTGSFIAGSEYLFNKIDIPIQQWSQKDGHHPFPIDNYFQYAPIVTVPILKLCGLESKHNWRDLACLTGGSILFATTFSLGLKYSLREERPYGGVFTSFPSGHTITAFMGAELLRREYGDEYPGIAIAGYVVATGVGYMRVYNNKHWASDVIAGAGFGILSASLTYWLAPYLRF